MGDSQITDVFSVSTDFSSSTQLAPFNQMDTVLYESLLTNTKRSLVMSTQETLSLEQFTSLLDDCSVCVNKALKFIVTIIEDQCVEISKLTHYLEDAVSILHLLPNIIKNMVELMNCSSMKTFPTVTGQIILTVFTHCKNSEQIYGSYLCNVEMNLKQLFRSCHELQITYLMALEKHFMIDLADTAESDILLEALDINLRIGEVVQSLDVKTMAEQWKAFTAICEKYSSYLNDSYMYNKTVQVLCEMITYNFRNACETENDDKLVLRSLKVASFTIKILLKICIIFKNSSKKEPECIVELLILLHLYSVTEADNPSNLLNVLNTYVLIPLDNLICELLSDTIFVDKLLEINSDILIIEKKLLGFTLVIICVMKILVQKSDPHTVTKCKIIDCVYTSLPYFHNLFQKRFKSASSLNNDHTFGLYEHLLINTVLFASTLDSEGYTFLEGKMYEALMGIDCCSALFSSDLWTFLGRISERQLLMDQLMFLCKNYQKLDSHYMFYNSPQRIHFSNTICKLFKILSEEDKIKFCKQFTFSDTTNRNLLKVLEVRNLPDNLRNTLEADIIADCKIALQKLITLSVRTPEQIDDLIEKLNITATCTIQDDSMSNYLIKAWLMTCNKNKVNANDYSNTSWFSKFIEALVLITKVMERAFYSEPNGMKVLHCITNLIETTSSDTKILLIDIICTIICFSNSLEYLFLEDNIVRIFNNLLMESDGCLKNSFITSLQKNINNQNVRKLLNRIFKEHKELEKIWTSSENSNDSTNFEIQEKYTRHKFIHKCSENFIEDNSKEHDCVSISSTDKKPGSNFDFADIDSLFESEIDSQPESKKLKLDNEIEQIVGRLEKDAYLLCNVKENAVEYRNRIQAVCDQLFNVIK